MESSRTPCPYCGEPIAAEAKKCRFCGEWLDEKDEQASEGPFNEEEVAGEFADYSGRGASAARSGRLFKKEPWSLRPDEKIITRSEPYRRRVIIFWLILGVPSLGVGFVLAGIVWLTYRFLRIEWILTDRRLIVVSGWLTRRARIVSLDKINEVNYTRRFWERVLWATGTVAVESAATQGTTELSPAADDDPFRQALEAQIEKRRRRAAAA